VSEPRREASHRILPAENVDHGRQRQIGNTVAVVREEHLLTSQKGLTALSRMPMLEFEAGVHECDLPVLDVAGEEIDLRPPSLITKSFEIVSSYLRSTA